MISTYCNSNKYAREKSRNQVSQQCLAIPSSAFLGSVRRYLHRKGNKALRQPEALAQGPNRTEQGLSLIPLSHEHVTRAEEEGGDRFATVGNTQKCRYEAEADLDDGGGGEGERGVRETVNEGEAGTGEVREDAPLQAVRARRSRLRRAHRRQRDGRGQAELSSRVGLARPISAGQTPTRTGVDAPCCLSQSQSSRTVIFV
jgi:hypothetical protein